MLNGDKVVLRPVRERDVAAFIDAHTEISNRGEFFPLGVQSEPVLRRTYAETGLWERDEGTLLIWNRDDVMVGHIEFLSTGQLLGRLRALLPAVRPGARRPGVHDRGGAPPG